MVLRVKNISKILYWLIAISAFFQLQPYFIWHKKSLNIIFSIITLSLYFIVYIRFNKKISLININITILAILVNSYLNYSSLNGVLLNNFLMSPIYIFILLPNKEKRLIYKIFIKIFAIALIPGIVIWIFNSLNIELQWKVLEPLNSLKTEAGIYYKQYWGSVVLYNPHNISKFYRLCGMFDEPGVIGTIVSLILVNEKYKIKSNRINKILCLGGVLSFSLFFYLVTIIYYLISSILEGNKKNSILLISIIVLFGMFNTGIIKNEFIEKNILSRLEIKDGKLSGDNRTDLYFNQRFDEFLNSKSSNIIFGMGKWTSDSDKEMAKSASWKKVVIDRGILGIALLIIFFIISAKIYGENKQGSIMVFAILLTIYQRPGVFNLPIIIIFIGGLVYQKNEIKKGKYDNKRGEIYEKCFNI